MPSPKQKRSRDEYKEFKENNTKLQQFINPLNKENEEAYFLSKVQEDLNEITREQFSTPQIENLEDFPQLSDETESPMIYSEKIDPTLLAIKEKHHHPITHLISFPSQINPLLDKSEIMKKTVN